MKIKLLRFVVFGVLLFWVMGVVSGQEKASDLPVLTMKTKLEKDEIAIFPYRVPVNYDPQGKEVHRVILNCVWQGTILDAWADQQGIFIVHVKFKNRLCWKVKEGYGQVVLDALEQLKKKYRVSTDQLLVYGSSRGGQFSNFFTTWKPEMVTAWVSNVPGVLDEPNDRLKNIPGLLTAGEGDDGRYQLGMRWMEKARKLKLSVIWRSYPNTGHEVTGACQKLSIAFLDYHHERTKGKLGVEKNKFNSAPAEPLPKPMFVGDSQEWKYFPLESEEAKDVLPEHRVELVTEEIAKLWSVDDDNSVPTPAQDDEEGANQLR